jgi:hypoxanthine phosphoribosyltransferase
MNKDIEVLFSESQIQSRVAELGAAITRNFEGLNLLLVGVLKGSFVFLADLCRKIELPLKIDFIGLSSYRDHTIPGPIRITSDLTQPIEGMDVLLVMVSITRDNTAISDR